MSNLAKKMEYKGKFVKGKIDSDALKYWEGVRDIFTENKIHIINFIEKWREKN